MSQTSPRRRVLILDRSGFKHYVNGPEGVVLPPAEYSVHVVSETEPIPEAQNIVNSWHQRGHTEDLMDLARRVIAQVGGCEGIVALHEGDLVRAAVLREEFDIPGDRPSEMVTFRDKVVMKERVGRHGVRVPENGRCEPSVVAWLLKRHGKVVIKPRDGCGSVGVRFVGSPYEARSLFSDLDAAERYEVEEFIEGDLFHVDSIVRQGLVVAAVASRYLDPTYGYTQGGSVLRSVSLGDSDLRAALLGFNSEVLNAYAWFSGVTHLEIFRTRDGELVFCEIAARAGGGGVAPCFHAITEIDLYATQIRAQLGLLPPKQVLVNNVSTGWLMLYGGPGTMTKPPAVQQAPWLLDPEVYVPDDGWLDKPADVSQAVITAGLVAGDERELLIRMEKVVDDALRSMVISPPVS